MNDIDDAVLSIDGEMTIYRAAELKQVLLAAAENRKALVLALAGVTEFDSAGLQLLALARRTALEMGREFRLASQSEAVSQVLDLLDLASHFGDQVVVPARDASSAPRPNAREAHGA